jgi:hypothetical protein
LRTTSYQEILQVTVGHDGLPIGRLLAEDQARIRDFVSLALPVAWESENWPELMRMEQRWFRAFYSSATTYAAGAEVFFVATGKYYQSLHSANTGNDPATGSTLVENSAHWAECQPDYSADAWVTGTVYSVGDQVQNTADGRIY